MILKRLDAVRGLLGNLDVVIHEPQQAVTTGHKQDDPNVGVGQVCPNDGGCQHREQDHGTAHRGRALFRQQVAFWSVGPNGLALLLDRAQPLDNRRTHKETDDHSGKDSQAAPRGCVAEQICERVIIGIRTEQKRQHVSALPTMENQRTSLSTILCTFDPKEPLTSHMSPA